jgi:hypothetical protein
MPSAPVSPSIPKSDQDRATPQRRRRNSKSRIAAGLAGVKAAGFEARQLRITADNEVIIDIGKPVSDGADENLKDLI